MREKIIKALVFDSSLFSCASAIGWAHSVGFHSSIPPQIVEKCVVLQQAEFEEGTTEGMEVFPITYGVVGIGVVLRSDLLKSFASNPDAGVRNKAGLGENKEVFNGEGYSNTAPGVTRLVGQEPGSNKKPVEKIEKRFAFAKSYVEKKIVIGAVYVPYDPEDETTIDLHGHAASAEDIEKAAYGFMEELKNYSIDRQHNKLPDYGYVVESYIAKSGDPLFKEGTWVVGVKVTDDTTWEKIQNGEVTGFSLGGSAVLQELVA